MIRPLLSAALTSLSAGAIMFGASHPLTAEGAEPVNVSPRPMGKIERLDPQLDAIVAPDAEVQVIAEGLQWSEGPVWYKDGACLLFSDVPRNTVYRWSEKDGLAPYLKPSGYTGAGPRSGGAKVEGVDEQGSNGLVIDPENHLVLCQHGDRRVARLAAPLNPGKKPEANFTTLADRWEGKRFNSPNDLVLHSSGAIYFTDPPYGLVKGGDPSTQEISFNGVYRISPEGEVTLVTRQMTKPNGLAFSPDEKTLYIGQSDSSAPLWRAFDVQSDGSLGEGKVFFDATKLAQAGGKGSPDGMKVDEHGNVLATGPGGVLIISPEGKHLGTIATGELVANCAFGNDGSTLYMTSHTYLCRVKLKTRGAGF